MSEFVTDMNFQIESAYTRAENNVHNEAVSRLTGNLKGKTEEEIENVSKDFEAMFLSQMLKPMFEGLETGGIFGGGHAEKVYRGLLIKEYAQVMTDRGGIGIADMVKSELLAIQGKIESGSSNAHSAGPDAEYKKGLETYNAASALNDEAGK